MSTQHDDAHPELVWNPGGDFLLSDDPETWQRLAVAAVEAGARQVVISFLPMSRWQLEHPRDLAPQWPSWPVWTMHNAGLLTSVPLPELADYLPAGEAERRFELLRQRHDFVTGELGAGCLFHANDPMWLPEQVYFDHPDWRGAQAELMRIAHADYWSPNIDHPEVLALYREAARKLWQACPRIVAYSSFTNDSSGAFPWSRSYPGSNGPEATRLRSDAERVCGFLGAIQDGAADAGAGIAVHLSNLPPNDGIYPALRDDMYVNNRDRAGRPFAAHVGGNGWFANHLYPVRGVPRLPSFLKQLEGAAGGRARYLEVSAEQTVAPMVLRVMARFLAEPTAGPAGRAALLHAIAALEVGDAAEQLLQIWEDIEAAVECIRHVRGRGYASLFLVGPAMMRWLTMPLVPDIEVLEPGERECWERHRVAKTAAEADSYHALLGTPGLVGEAAAWMARNSLSEAMRLFAGAAAGSTRLAAAADGEAAANLRHLAACLRAARCCAFTCRNFVDYRQVLVERGDTEELVNFHDPEYGIGMINRKSYELRRLARAEIDNVHELAGLIDNAERPLLFISDDAAAEDPFTFGPDTAAQLRRKARTMFAHWTDYLSLYPPLPEVRPDLPLRGGPAIAWEGGWEG